MFEHLTKRGDTILAAIREGHSLPDTRSNPTFVILVQRSNAEYVTAIATPDAQGWTSGHYFSGYARALEDFARRACLDRELPQDWFAGPESYARK